MSNEVQWMNYSGFGRHVVAVALWWTVAFEGVAALLLGIAKFYTTEDDPYAPLFLAAACILVFTAAYDTTSSIIRMGDEGWSQWLKVTNVVFECIFAVLAIVALIFSALAVGYDDKDSIKSALEATYIVAVIKYSGKIIIKGLKAAVKTQKTFPSRLFR